VPPEIAVELRNLDELGPLVGDYILLETSQVPYKALICPTSQEKFCFSEFVGDMLFVHNSQAVRPATRFGTTAHCDCA